MKQLTLFASTSIRTKALQSKAQSAPPSSLALPTSPDVIATSPPIPSNEKRLVPTASKVPQEKKVLTEPKVRVKRKIVDDDSDVGSEGPAPPPSPSASVSSAESDEPVIKPKVTKPASKAASKKKLKPVDYDPEQQATWKRNEPVPYAFLAEAFERIEATTKRLEITSIATNVFRSVIAMTPDDLLPTVCLVTNQLAPAFEGVELGVGEGVLLKTLASATGKQEKQLKAALRNVQDLGVLAKESRSKQMTMSKPKPLTVRRVYEQFVAIAKCSGKSSQTDKQAKINSLLVASLGSEAQYIVRALSGNLRIGLQQQTATVALAHAFVLTPTGKEDLELKRLAKEKGQDVLEVAADIVKQSLSECPSYPAVVTALLQHGVGQLPLHCSLRVGIPVKPMLAKPTKGVSFVLDRMENDAFTCEFKYDGERAQIHLLESGQVLIYSRNLENNTTKYPDVIESLPLCTKGVTSCILDCEVVAVNTVTHEILPFQVLSTRARKGVSIEDVKIQVCLFAFDLLYLNAEPLISKTLRQRRELLKQHFCEVPNKFFFATSIDNTDASEIEAFLHTAVTSQCEGLMVKTLDTNASYQPSRRSLNWLKLKKDYLDGVTDSLDLVPIGAWFGKGKRMGVYGAYLLACYNPDEEEFQTICKIGTGFSEEQLSQLHASFKDLVLTTPRQYYRFSDVHTPDVWLDAKQVWEVLAADLSVSPVHQAAVGLVDSSKGIALRFPRFIRVRDDKSPEDATSSDQVREMYLAQAITKAPGGHEDDDY